MAHFYESTLIETNDGIQCKVYANSHPQGYVIVKPKYIPDSVLRFVGLKKRFLFSKCMTRFNLFNSKEIVKENLDILKSKFPEYYYQCPKHNNWFLVVPREKIKRYYDPQEGVRQLMKVPVKDLDPYLTATRELIELILGSGITLDDIGISHSTLLGNYTPGKSDIDILIFGKEEGWKVINFMEKVEHPALTWKSGEQWAKYYRDRIVSKQFNEEEYVFNMLRKKDDGYFHGNVFSIFCLEKEGETWYNWDDTHEPLGTVKIQGIVSERSHSHIRPGYYSMKDTVVLEGYQNVPIKRIVTWSRPFVLQAREEDKVEAVGLLERVNCKNGESYYQVVLGYFDTYTSERGEQEYMKALVR